jgi:hypothetical protein
MNTTRATINELLLGYYINGNKWFDADAERTYKQQSKMLKRDELKIETSRAKQMSTDVILWATKHKYALPVKGVYWVAKRGALRAVTGIDTDSYESENPSDILIKFARGPAGKFEPFLGVSAKSTHQAKPAQFKNPGIGTVESALKLSLSRIVDNATDEIIELFDLSAIQHQRESEIRRSTHISKWAHAKGLEVIEEIRDMVLNKMSHMNKSALRMYFLQDWLDATERFPPYILVTGRGETHFTTHIMNPLENDRLAKLNSESIVLEKEGGSTIRVRGGGTIIFKIRAKWKSTPLASSFKFAAGF